MEESLYPCSFVIKLAGLVSVDSLRESMRKTVFASDSLVVMDRPGQRLSVDLDFDGDVYGTVFVIYSPSINGHMIECYGGGLDDNCRVSRNYDVVGQHPVGPPLPSSGWRMIQGS